MLASGHSSGETPTMRAFDRNRAGGRDTPS
jgi:hypothetical protein